MALLLASPVEGVVEVEALPFGLELDAISVCLCLFANFGGLDGLLEVPG